MGQWFRDNPLLKLVANALVTLIPFTASLIISALGGGLIGSGIAFLIVSAGVFFAYYIKAYVPATDRKERQLTTFFEQYLDLLVEDFKHEHPGQYNLRMNIMRPKGSWWRRVDDHLSIDYCVRGYTSIEQELQFTFGQACCGVAMAENEAKWVDKNRDPGRGWAESWQMNNKQEEATEDVQTILSTPIYRPEDENQERPIAILNIDSEEPSSATGFDQEEVQDTAARYARGIGILL